MSELVFHMGNFAATFPVDRLYAKNHMWAKLSAAVGNTGGEQSASANGVWRFGFSAYAVRLLQDVYFLDWSVSAGATVAERQQIGFIESKKAESDLFSPMAGRIGPFNSELLADPSTINVDKYERGWLFEMTGSAGSLLTPEAYLEHLAAVWEVTQRTIKGQVNQS